MKRDSIRNKYDVITRVAEVRVSGNSVLGDAAILEANSLNRDQ